MTQSSAALAPHFNNKVTQLLCMLCMLFTQACAHIKAPEGGPKDEVPPKLIATKPAQGSTKFQKRVITLTFDKPIEANSIKSKLVVTPKLEKPAKKPSYTHSIYGKTLKVKLNVPLAQDTTYTFNFNDAIKDTTEGNKAEAPTLTFSTGDQIDTMYIKGQVRDHMTQQPAPGVQVGLYKAGAQRPNYLEDTPDYFTKADEKGIYHLEHISKGTYYMYANSSSELKIDPAVDQYGFLTEPIDLTTTSAEDILLSVLKADIRPPKLESRQTQGPYFELRFNKAIDRYTLTLPQDGQEAATTTHVYSHWLEDKQTVRIYNTFGLLEEDNIQVQLTAQDALGQTVEELIKLQFSEKGTKDAFAYSLAPGTESAIDVNWEATITCNKPIKSVFIDRFHFLVNEKEVIKLNDSDWQLNEQRNILTLKKPLAPSLIAQLSTAESSPAEARTGLVLQIDEGALVSIEKDESPAQTLTYFAKDAQAYGIIRGTIITQAPGFIIQLLNENYEVVQEMRNQQHYQFENVIPGNYKIRALMLKGPEEAWDHGNIMTNQAPDAVAFYKETETITMLPNWIMEHVDITF